MRIYLSSIVTALLLSACGANSTPAAVPAPAAFDTPIPNQVEVHAHAEEEGHDHVHLEPEQVNAEMGVALVASELVVGPNRFAVGLFDAQGSVVHDAEVHFHYYILSNSSAPLLESHGKATRLQSPDGLTTIFAQQRDFAEAGEWGVEIQAKFGDGRAAIKRISFTVLPDSPTLKVGDKVPTVDTPVAADKNGDLSLLTSAKTPNPTFYAQSLLEAIATQKPTVLLIATPAFCQTRFCGPAYELTSELQKAHAGEVNFVHVEVYTGLPNPNENNWEVAPVMTALGLSTEPWLFLINGSGIVTYRVEGMFTAGEVEDALQALLRTPS